MSQLPTHVAKQYPTAVFHHGGAMYRVTDGLVYDEHGDAVGLAQGVGARFELLWDDQHRKSHAPCV